MAEKRLDWSERMRGVFEMLPGASAPPPSAPDDEGERARDLAEERAAIMEFDGGMPREKAEALAYMRHGLVPPGRR
jgi:hypothetical protein